MTYIQTSVRQEGGVVVPLFSSAEVLHRLCTRGPPLVLLAFAHLQKMFTNQITLDLLGTSDSRVGCSVIKRLVQSGQQ
jgi:hypothetical protein